jgi:hypothetical protein
LWGAFLLADEILIAYAVEGTHMSIFTAQIATLLVVELLPERPPAHENRLELGKDRIE